MKCRPFKQVDVFTATPYLGNPLAVVLDGSDLSDAQMQQFAHWTNLSETTFVLPPTDPAADYRVRIFAPSYEMPFAGHPTLGTCHAWLEHGGTPQDRSTVVQQCQVGLVKVQRNQGTLAFAAPALQRKQATAALVAQLTQALGLAASDIVAAQHLSNGPHHFALLLNRVEALWDTKPDAAALLSAMQAAGVTGVGCTAPREPSEAPALIARSNREARAFGNTPEPDREVRFFFNAGGNAIIEDPATGSFNASLAQWLMAEGHAPKTYRVAQGTCIGRESRIHITQDSSGQVWVGGDCVTCIDGSVSL